MRHHEDRIFLSASDLMRFIDCRHATALDLRRLRGEDLTPAADREDASLLQAHGDAHEAAHLAALKASGRRVVEIAREGHDLATGVAATRAALADGPDVVFQGALAGGAWGGWSDFLERVEKPSALGGFSYEVTDTKLKRKADPKHVLQLVLYSDLLTELQGAAPEHAHVALGGGGRATIRLQDYAAYARRSRARLEAFVADPPPTAPVPVAACALCRWRDHCAGHWAATDSLFQVANITRAQVAKLTAAGITTMRALGERRARVPRLADATLEKLATQARLQTRRSDGGGPAFALRPHQPGKGFDLLPRPDPGDLFYDIEGDPFVEGGLEHLHGVWAEDAGFRAFWAHDHDEERARLGELMDFLDARLTAHPRASVYHYAPYEITALRRLTTRYGVGEARLDRWLRERRFVDLYAVVRGAIIASEPSYSIKDIEAFYEMPREGAVKTAGGSVVAYERWRVTGEAAILDEIEDYNRIDCVSTQRLRDWLMADVRPAGHPWPAPVAPAADRQAEADAEAAALIARLDAAALSDDRRRLLFDLAFFHRREAKPGWWAVFDGLARETEEMIDDVDCLGGLQAVGPAETVARSHRRTFRFPEQQTKLRAGANASIGLDGAPVGVTLEALDRSTGRATVKASTKMVPVWPDSLDLLPGAPINTKVLRDAIHAVIDDQCGPRALTAADDLLARRPPRLTPRREAAMMQGADPVAGVVSAVLALDGGVLPIQGPPGTGKTFVAARAILALVRQGKRVAVAASSHEAIGNVLIGCIDALEAGDYDAGVEIELARKISGEPPELAAPYDRIVQATGNDDPVLSSADVVGGTAWLFARDEFAGAFDTLFVDEAGQMSLANLVAMARCARNIVLIGDPLQLPQVIQGAHPPPADRSALEWLLGDAATVPADRGIFLPVSRRMHPDVCGFVSAQVYEGRLDSHPDTARQRIDGAGALPPHGAHLVFTEHAARAQEAPEEVAAIAAIIDRLLGAQVTGRDGVRRPLRLRDIIVVAPYNAQVNALVDALPPGAQVGTVDKFQGKEAAVCLVSMTSSSAEDTPRGLDFLFSLNRINVAVSRAKALCLVFASPRLLEARCATVADMRLVNTLCALAEHAPPLTWRGDWA